MIADAPGGSILDIRVIPRAGKAGLAGTRHNALLIRLASPPVDGAANAELLALLAHALDVARRSLLVLSGEKARTKRVKVIGLSATEVRRRLNLG